MRTTGGLCVVALCVAIGNAAPVAQSKSILRDVKTVQVNATVVSAPEKVKEEFAPTLVQDALKNALKQSHLEVGNAPVRAHIQLDEFTSGSAAKRFLVGFGAGRATVKARLIFTDAAGKELANVKLEVKGDLLFSSYQSGSAQRNQAVEGFDRKLVEEIARLK